MVAMAEVRDSIDRMVPEVVVVVTIMAVAAGITAAADITVANSNE